MRFLVSYLERGEEDKTVSVDEEGFKELKKREKNGELIILHVIVISERGTGISADVIILPLFFHPKPLRLSRRGGWFKCLVEQVRKITLS